MQRREEQASEHDHQPAEAGDQLMPHQLQLGLQIGPDLAQVGSDEFQILLGSNVVVDRIEDLGSDALGFLAIDVGVRQGVGQGKPVSQWRLRLVRSAFGRGGRPVRNRPCRGAHLIRRAAIVASSPRLRKTDSPSRKCHSTSMVRREASNERCNRHFRGLYSGSVRRKHG